MSSCDVLLFGCFDGLHAGHQFILAQAKRLGKKMIVVLAPDAVIPLLKNKIPRFTQQERKQALEREGDIEVILGDTSMGTYTVLQQIQPRCILFGYDQERLQEDVAAWYRVHPEYEVPVMHTGEHAANPLLTPPW